MFLTRPLELPPQQLIKCRLFGLVGLCFERYSLATGTLTEPQTLIHPYAVEVQSHPHVLLRIFWDESAVPAMAPLLSPYIVLTFKLQEMFLHVSLHIHTDDTKNSQ